MLWNGWVGAGLLFWVMYWQTGRHLQRDGCGGDDDPSLRKDDDIGPYRI